MSVQLSNEAAPSAQSLRILVLGCGAIGLNWVKLALDHAHEVIVIEPDAKVRSRLQSEYRDHTAFGCFALIADAYGDLERVDLVIECVPEDLSLKRQIFNDCIKALPDHAIWASASSAIPISEIVESHDAGNRALVIHPLNPPNLIAVVEIVPSRTTSADVTLRAQDMMRSVGRKPVVLKKESFGFAANRLQLAVMREAAQLVEEDVLSPADIDTLFTHGLALRWAIEGPCRTLHLNRESAMRDYVVDIADHLVDLAAVLSRSPHLSIKGFDEIIRAEDAALAPGEIGKAITRRNTHLEKLGAFMCQMRDQ